MSRFSELEIFVQVVEVGSLSKAAEALGVSKSHVSKTLGVLEDRLGARLLHRTTRKLSLTDEGQAFHERGTRILADVREAERAVSATAAAPQGRLRMTLPPSLGRGALPSAIADFMAAYPDVEVHADFTERSVDLVDDGYDLAVRVSQLADSSFIARRLAPVSLFVCGSDDYFAEHGEPSAPDELEHHTCLLYSRQGPHWHFRGPDRDFSVRVSGRMSTNNSWALVEAAALGLGLAQLPSFDAAEPIRQGRLRPILTQYSEWGAAYVVYPHRKHLSPKVRAFVDFLVERFRTPRWDVPR